MSGDTTAETRSANNNTNSSSMQQAVLPPLLGTNQSGDWGSRDPALTNHRPVLVKMISTPGNQADGQQLSLLCVTSNVFLIKFSIHLRTGSIALFHAYCLNVGHET